jgi:hypothetical protein
VQVKRAALPLRISRADWNRMEADPTRFGWRWIVACVSPDDVVTLLDPARAKRGSAVRLDAAAAIENVVAWIDSAPVRRRPSRRARRGSS